MFYCLRCWIMVTLDPATIVDILLVDSLTAIFCYLQRWAPDTFFGIQYSIFRYFNASTRYRYYDTFQNSGVRYSILRYFINTQQNVIFLRKKANSGLKTKQKIIISVQFEDIRLRMKMLWSLSSAMYQYITAPLTKAVRPPYHKMPR
jgi:hypothetical protein